MIPFSGFCKLFLLPVVKVTLPVLINPAPLTYIPLGFAKM